ncbi:MAG: hypothetical protein ACK559_11555, partial [bacterium]
LGEAAIDVGQGDVPLALAHPAADRSHGHQRVGDGGLPGDPQGLELLLDLVALAGADAAVVGPADGARAAPREGQLVEALGEALAEAPAVGEDQRASVPLDEVEHARLQHRPDPAPVHPGGAEGADLG